MRKISEFILVVTLILSSSIAFAAGPLHGKKISKVAFQSGHFFIYSDGWDNPNTCDNTNAVMLQVDDPNFDKAYSLLLAAYMAGKTVSGYSDDCREWDGKEYNTIRGHKYLVVQ